MTFGEDGFKGNGGGARSGSELSHLVSSVSYKVVKDFEIRSSYMGIVRALPWSKDAEFRCTSFLSSILSREASLSTDGMLRGM